MQSGEIIRIENDLIIIRIISDNSIIKIHRSNFVFNPKIGDFIEIFKNDNETIVTKIEKESETSKINFDSDNINIDSNGNIYVDEPGSNGKKAVNKFKYCLLAFFLGSMGFHQFYRKKWEIGLFYLVLSSLSLPTLIIIRIISFIDFFTALSKKTDINGNILI